MTAPSPNDLDRIEYRDLHCAQPVCIAHNFDRGDSIFKKLEPQHSEEPTLRRHDEADFPIHHCRARKPGTARRSNCLLCPLAGAAHLALHATHCRCCVSLNHKLGIKHREERFHVATSQCCKKRTHYLASASGLSVGRYGGPANTPTGTAGKLSRRLRRPIQYRCDFVKGKIEEIMQHKGEPLSGIQSVEHHEECHPNRVSQQRLLFRVNCVACTMLRIGYRVRRPWCIEGLLAPRRPRAENIETDARHNSREPSAEILDLVGIGTVQPEPCFLHRIVGFIQ